MNDISTVLVLGAGSNAHLGFPSGLALTERIINQTAESSVSELRQMMEFSFSANEVRRFRLQLLQSQCTSIDRFLQLRPEFADIGKHAIAMAILQCERELGGVDFTSGKIPDLFRVRDNWYELLLNGIGSTHERVQSANLKVVTFNYDRSLEQYLTTALMARHGISGQQALSVISPLEITHAYGAIGDIEQSANFASIVPYGAGPTGVNYSACADRLQVVDDRADDSDVFVRVRKLMESADRIVFLGFGFDSVNVKRLFTYMQSREQSVSGTAHSLTDVEMEIATQEMMQHVLLKTCALYNAAGQSTVLEYLRRSGVLARKTYFPKSLNGGSVTMG